MSSHLHHDVPDTMEARKFLYLNSALREELQKEDRRQQKANMTSNPMPSRFT